MRSKVVCKVLSEGSKAVKCTFKREHLLLDPIALLVEVVDEVFVRCHWLLQLILSLRELEGVHTAREHSKRELLGQRIINDGLRGLSEGTGPEQIRETSDRSWMCTALLVC